MWTAKQVTLPTAGPNNKKKGKLRWTPQINHLTQILFNKTKLSHSIFGADRSTLLHIKLSSDQSAIMELPSAH